MEVSEITLEQQLEEKYRLQILIEDAIAEFRNKTGLLVYEITIKQHTSQCAISQSITIKTDLL